MRVFTPGDRDEVSITDSPSLQEHQFVRDVTHLNGQLLRIALAVQVKLPTNPLGFVLANRCEHPWPTARVIGSNHRPKEQTAMTAFAPSAPARGDVLSTGQPPPKARRKPLRPNLSGGTMSAANLTDVEKKVLDVLTPGGLLTLETLARRTGRQVWEVRRAANSLRVKNLAWANRRGRWSAS